MRTRPQKLADMEKKIDALLRAQGIMPGDATTEEPGATATEQDAEKAELEKELELAAQAAEL